jgi:tetratricopeptide (TPR) repeat protein
MDPLPYRWHGGRYHDRSMNPFKNAAGVLLLVLGASPARGDVGPTFARALDKGRKLEATGDHQGALKAYDEALAVRPDDPTVLSEVSVSALAAGDLARARDAATRAAQTNSPRMQAAAYYNLGQVEEKARAVDKAVAAYRAAMDACPITAAHGRLAKLAPKVALELDTLEATTPEGPFETLAKAGAATKCDVDEGQLDDGKSDAPARAPFLAVRTLACEARRSVSAEDKLPGNLGFALRLKSGWYVVAEAKEDDPAAMNRGGFDLTHDWPGVGPVLEWHGSADHHHTSGSHAGSHIDDYHTVSQVACAVDRAGEPYCLPSLRVAESEYEGMRTYKDENDETGTLRGEHETSWSIELKYVAGGVLASGASDCAPLPGKHPVKLP